ncbi:esterase/lipase family protein [Pseudomonas frederiksbergensis]|uniref:esterase/lipase family protein n=1 Tax=Pseudomonas frederiksbergensis TaxID=104087 RepID=UPI001F4250F0|nr:alpha/beta fold hydrolase [Pseudomonas frederiksbergensis]
MTTPLSANPETDDGADISGVERDDYAGATTLALGEAICSNLPCKLRLAATDQERGEKLLEQVNRILQETGAAKVNLIGHGQGPLAARYVAALHPEKVASVTSVSYPNHGSEIADQLHKALTPGELPEAFVLALLSAVGTFISLISGHPQGVPKHWGGEGNEIENGVYYYSWSGILQNVQTPQLLDPTPINCIVLSTLFYKEKDANDGLVGHGPVQIPGHFPEHRSTARYGSRPIGKNSPPLQTPNQRCPSISRVTASSTS